MKGNETEAKENNSGEVNETDPMEYDDDKDDEIDELEQMMKQLEPKYRRYANWRI